VTPDPLKIGVRIEEKATKAVSIANEGYAAMNNVSLSVHDPGENDWITVLNGSLDTIEPGQSKTSQIYVDPPDGITMGTYVVHLDLHYDERILPVYLTVEITTAAVGRVSFKVYDDAGMVVPGAEVSLISKEFYVNVTRREGMNITTSLRKDRYRRLSASDRHAAGDYRYLVTAARHDQGQRRS
jgi:hypothetical protein